MAVYQVPQFLDSGDKIVFGMTIWQLMYAMVGFFLSIGMFSLVNNSLPFLGVWSFVPVIPVASLALYLSLGKFNGRDSDVYILKFIIMLARPRKMVYKRKPNNYDLDAKLTTLTVEKIEKTLQDRLVKSTEDKKDGLYDFKSTQSEQKARIIRQMGSSLDETLYNTMQTVSRKSLEVEAKQNFLEEIEKKRLTNSGTGWNKFMRNQPAQNNQPVSQNASTQIPEFQPTRIKDYIAKDMNFFDLDEKDSNNNKTN